MFEKTEKALKNLDFLHKKIKKILALCNRFAYTMGMKVGQSGEAIHKSGGKHQE